MDPSWTHPIESTTVSQQYQGPMVSDEFTADTGPSNRRPVVREDLSGTQFQGYALIKKLGTGGNGSVYEALHLVTKQLFAIKVMHRQIAPSSTTERRFAQEIESVKVLRHDNIIALVDVGSLADNRAFYVMERFAGTSLSQYVRERGRMPMAKTLDVLQAVCAGLRAAHQSGVIHRDVKPGNVLIGERHDELVIKLIDFGIAKVFYPDGGDAGLTADHVRLGSPVAMAPEQVRGSQVDARTDIYGLGVLGFYILTGQYPFRAETGTPLERHHLLTPPPRASSLAPVSTQLDELLLRCLAKDPDARYANAAEVSDALGRCRAEAPMRSAVYACRAVGIHLRAITGVAASPDADTERDDGNEGDEGDDELLMAIDDMMAVAAEILTDAGLRIEVSGGDSLLATRVLAADHAEDQIDSAVDAIMELYDLFEAEGQGPLAVDLVGWVGVGDAVVEHRDGEDVIVGGAIAGDAWLPDDPTPGVFLIEDGDVRPLRPGIRGGAGPLAIPSDAPHRRADAE